MATLTQTAYLSRKTIKYGSAVLVAFLILRSIFLIVSTYWRKAHPAPLPPPTVAFDKLPKLNFPARTGLPPITLKLETISGVLPKFPDRAKVYFMPQVSPNLLAWDSTKAWARSLGFTQEPETPDKFSFRFKTETSPKTTLEVNVLTRNFSLSYDWKNDLDIFSGGSPPQESQAISLAKAFLQRANLLLDDLITGAAEVTYLKYNQGNLNKALFYSEANFVKVNLFRQNVDEMRILPPNPKDANISFLLSSSSAPEKSIVETRFIHFLISWTNFATYPIKDANTAWTQLASGKGFIANLGNNPSGKVTVRNAYLAYFDSDTAQNFLQPIIVFEGDNDFYAFVPAVIDTWREQ